jgi:hypothetical protein
MSSEEYDDWSGLLAMNATVRAYGIAEKKLMRLIRQLIALRRQADIVALSHRKH